MRLYFSTVIREAPLRSSGELVSLDWNTKQVLARTPVHTVDPFIEDPNPRGNTRGGRGIAVDDTGVVVCSYHSIRRYDHALVHKADITNGLLVGLHECHVETPGRLWVTATAIDAALEIDLETGDVVSSFWPREDERIQEALDVEPLDIDKQADNRTRFVERRHLEHESHLHLNAIATWRGERFAVLHRPGVIANLDAGAVVVKGGHLRRAHNLLIDDDGHATANDTWGRTIRTWDLRTGEVQSVIDLMESPFVQDLASDFDRDYERALAQSETHPEIELPPRPIFVRGLDRFGGDLFVGISPATILQVRETSGEVVDAYQYSDDVFACVHGLQVMPA